MKVIIAGSRDITDPSLIPIAVANAQELHGIFVTEVVSGKCPRGVDKLGEEWADAHGINWVPFPAKWRTPDGRKDLAAGFKRNVQMGVYADALIAVWDGKSHGTAHMIRVMKDIVKKPYYVMELR